MQILWVEKYYSIMNTSVQPCVTTDIINKIDLSLKLTLCWLIQFMLVPGMILYCFHF